MADNNASKSLNVRLFRRGEWYSSMDCTIVHESMPTTVCIAPLVMILDDARWFKSSIAVSSAAIDRHDRERIVRDATRLFLEGNVSIPGLGRQSFADFCELLWLHNGLTENLVRKWAVMLTGIFERQTETADSRNSRQIVFVSLPSNTFMCIESCLNEILADNIPMMRPSVHEPFSASRMTACLLEAGLPVDRIGLYPCGHEIVPSVVRKIDRSILFGGMELETQFSGMSNVTINGPGRACAIVGPHDNYDDIIDELLHLIASNAGRFCINVGTVLSYSIRDELCKRLAEKIDSIPVDTVHDGGWPLTYWLDHDYVCRTEKWIRERLQPGDEIITKRPIVEKYENNRYVLVPTLVKLSNPDTSPLIGVELPFPFAVIADAGSIGKALEFAKNSRFVYKVSVDPMFENADLPADMSKYMTIEKEI